MGLLDKRNDASKPTVTIVTAKCTRNGAMYGIRFEKMGSDWVGTWAFAVQEKSASREGYDRNEIRGNFVFDQKYPGCPHCENTAIFKCSCGKVACYDGNAREVKCPWCKRPGRIEGVADSLSGGGDI